MSSHRVNNRFSRRVDKRIVKIQGKCYIFVISFQLLEILDSVRDMVNYDVSLVL